MRALTARQDALSRRSARAMAGILDTRVPRGVVDDDWAEHVEYVGRVLRAIPGRFVARRPELVEPGVQPVHDLLLGRRTRARR